MPPVPPTPPSTGLEEKFIKRTEVGFTHTIFFQFVKLDGLNSMGNVTRVSLKRKTGRMHIIIAELTK